MNRRQSANQDSGASWAPLHPGAEQNQQPSPPQQQPILWSRSSHADGTPQLSISLTPTTKNTTSSTDTTTPPGFNKNRRDLSKLLLSVVVVALITNANTCATAASAGAILFLKQGTLLSHKNWKWGALAAVSFAVSLSCGILWQGYSMVEEDKAYGLKISLWLLAKFLQVFWSVTLGLFLFSAVASSSSETSSLLVQQQTAVDMEVKRRQ